MKWINTRSHNAWLDAETDRIFEFGRNSVVPNGFGWIGNNGNVREEMGARLWITARMLHCYALAAHMGRPGAYDLVEHGIAALEGPLKDKEHGGWFATIDNEGQGIMDSSKQGYQHAFVLLGAASAVTTGHPRAQSLLDEAINVYENRFWVEEKQMCYESWDQAWTETEDYRGGNMAMHSVEAFLIVYDVTKDKKWLDRALNITEFMINKTAKGLNYRVNEHFDADWEPLPDYNKDTPASHFRAYGGTPGHWIEWGRLICHLRATLQEISAHCPDWLLEDAVGLFDATIRDAWHVDGAPGFVYSVDWEGKPVVRERIRWAPVEAIGTAYALYTVTGDKKYEDWYRIWWDYCRTYLIDYEGCSWWQELDVNNQAGTSVVWDGKQDIYHLMHCLVIPRLPLTPGLAPALSKGLLDDMAR
ncbi:AGE family epimerase/isomerase [Vibrio paucivorans]|uniref:AGE family epimerase/isomerase n=1 Tax=Vibrio paucivorans TaxID=2829489 RepID=A0A9X3CCQ9_9VIBR|nr:AGE family epimerase/isomerase [Vibrio paucivorans]MCW8333262.1 AGE family epimerase/isomerase [Vibrio paucivorans]